MRTKAKKSKKLKITSFLIFIVLLIGILTIGLAERAYAAAECFFSGPLTGGVSGTVRVPCDSGTFRQEYESLIGRGLDFQDNTCYVILDSPGGGTSAGTNDCATLRERAENAEDAEVSEQLTPFQNPSSTRLSNPERDEIANCGEVNEEGNVSEAQLRECLNENPLVELITLAINILSAGAGVIITLMIVVAGIQYSTAGANPQAVNAAKGKIMNSVIALLALIFLYSFLQWLVPGGIF